MCSWEKNRHEPLAGIVSALATFIEVGSVSQMLQGHRVVQFCPLAFIDHLAVSLCQWAGLGSDTRFFKQGLPGYFLFVVQHLGVAYQQPGFLAVRESRGGFTITLQGDCKGGQFPRPGSGPHRMVSASALGSERDRCFAGAS